MAANPLLTAGVTMDDQTTALTDAERRDIAYHRPPRVGDVIFNWFD